MTYSVCHAPLKLQVRCYLKFIQKKRVISQTFNSFSNDLISVVYGSKWFLCEEKDPYVLLSCVVSVPISILESLKYRICREK